MERIRDVKITVEIDTNKATYRESFVTLEGAIEFYNSHLDTNYGLYDKLEEKPEKVDEE